MLYDRWARSTYDKFRIMQPQIATNGVWEDNKKYFILCPEITNDTQALDGKLLKNWFDCNCRPLSAPIYLTSNVFDGAVLLPERTLNDQIKLGGEPLTITDIYRCLFLELRREFPTFKIKEDFENQQFLIYVDRQSTPSEEANFAKAFSTLQAFWSYKIEVKPNEINHSNILDTNMELTHSRRLRNFVSAKLLSLVETDEDFWLDNRASLLTDTFPSVPQKLTTEWVTPKSKCLVGFGLGQPINIRNYMSSYRQIYLILPVLKPEQEILLDALKISESELIKLIQLGNVKLILPNSVEHFDLKILEKVANECPENSMLMSRQLASLTVMESRRRMPLLYPPLGVKDRQYLLNEILVVAKKVKDKKISDFLFALQSTLSDIWTVEHIALHNRGAMAIATLGFGRLCGDTLYSLSAVDRRLELYTSSFAVEFAGALHASLIPGKTDNYHELAFTEILASIYSGVPGTVTMDFSSKLEILAENILCINNDMPVVELADTLKDNPDIEALRHLLSDLSKNDLNNLSTIISQFNKAVKRYEKNSDQLKKLDIRGLKEVLIAVAGTTCFGAEKALYLTLGFWIINVLTNYLPDNSTTRSIFDLLKGVATFSQPDAVLVSRFRNEISKLKN